MTLNQKKRVTLSTAGLMIIAALLFVVLVIVCDLSCGRKRVPDLSCGAPKEEKKSPSAPSAQVTGSAALSMEKEREDEEEGSAAAIKEIGGEKKKNKKIYIILDDAGHNISQLVPFLKFPGKLTISVLPGLSYSKEAAELAHKYGKTVILHQPMEAIGGNDPGPGAVFKSMGNDEIYDIVNHNLDSIPYAEGMNNHMGSAATSDLRIMSLIMEIIKKRSLLFIDSYTYSGSVCQEAAKISGLSIAKRDVFLDNVDNKEKIMEALNQGREISERKGYAIMIGHVWSSELADTMMEIYPNFIEDGFCFEDVSDFFVMDDNEEEG